MPARSVPAGSSRALLSALEPVCGERKQFRGGLQVPVCGSGVDVPEVGAQQRDPGLDVLAVAAVVAVGVKQRVDREGMSQVVLMPTSA